MKPMYKTHVFILLLIFQLGGMQAAALTTDEKHLFILSGQSNMARFNEKLTFVPAVETAFGRENVIVVKDAKGGQPIRRWYKDWSGGNNRKPQQVGDLYDSLLAKVKQAVGVAQIASVTFLWMQGEADAKAGTASSYRKALEGLFDQLRRDLDRDDLNIVIGRLSDFDMQNSKFMNWTDIRHIQVHVANSSERYSWIDTDDLNDGLNKKGEMVKDDLHYTPQGYRIFGERLASAAIALIRN